jgi:hypothetical protein
MLAAQLGPIQFEFSIFLSRALFDVVTQEAQTTTVVSITH